jgi:DUF4097 and DUF4098 domain-containing protein YvlB
MGIESESLSVVCRLPFAVCRSPFAVTANGSEAFGLRLTPLTFSADVRTSLTKETSMLRSRVALAVFLITSAAYAAETPIHRSFNVAPGGTLTIETDVGDIRVDPSGSGVTVDVTQVTHVSKRHLEVTFDQQQNDVTVRAKLEPMSSRWFNWSDDDARFVVTVPSRYNVHLKTSGGEIKVGNLQGETRVKTSGGGITLGRIDGQVNADTSGGDVSLEGGTGNIDLHTSGGGIRIGDANASVTAKTSGGSIEIRRVAGDLLARTSGGGITIGEANGTVDAQTSGGSIKAQLAQQPRADSRLSTSGGGITISIAPNVSVDVDAHTSGGDVDTDVPITLLGKQEDSSLQGKINGGGPKLVLRSSGGNIRLRKL